MQRKEGDRIIYVGFYDSASNSAESRTSHLPATNKMDYICTAINAAGREVLIVSPSRTANRRSYPGRVSVLNEMVSLKVFRTLPWGNRLQRAMSILAGNAFLFMFLVRDVGRRETVIVYHSLSLMRVVRLAQRLRGFTLVLEVEEVYQHVVQVSAATARAEWATLRNADAYIFSTELLNESVNPSHRPHITIHGTYQVEPDRGSRIPDGRIHVVYAGIIGFQKGASLAASAAGFLDSRYHVHIAGFGEEREIQRLRDQVAEVGRTSECRLTYDGLYRGDDFLDFLQGCDIGLSTQLPEARFSDTSFPSKVLSYLANGLAVVSVRIPAVEQSKVAGEITFYDGQDPEVLATAIRSVQFPRARDSRALIERLNAEFIDDLRLLLDGMQRQ